MATTSHFMRGWWVRVLCGALLLSIGVAVACLVSCWIPIECMSEGDFAVGRIRLAAGTLLVISGRTGNVPDVIPLLDIPCVSAGGMCGLRTGIDGNTGGRWWWIRGPLWIPNLAILLASSALLGMRARRAILHRREGLCKVCGYDLRGGGLRCPECGRFHLERGTERTFVPGQTSRVTERLRQRTRAAVRRVGPR